MFWPRFHKQIEPCVIPQKPLFEVKQTPLMPPVKPPAKANAADKLKQVKACIELADAAADDLGLSEKDPIRRNMAYALKIIEGTDSGA